MSIRTGFDTGLFVLLAAEAPEAVELWKEVTEGEREGVVSHVSLLELYRLGLRGSVPLDFCEEALETIAQVCEVYWLERMDQLRFAARLGHGNGLSLADSVILSCLIDLGCHEIYTTDRDLLSYRGEQVRVLLLKVP